MQLPAPNSFRQRLLSGAFLAGSFIKTPTAHATEILGFCGYDFIVVDQEPIFIPRNFTDKRITWQLPRDSRYRFDRENGVTVGPEVSSGHRAFSECKPEMNALRYTCRNDGTPGSYKYTIRVTGPASVPPLDPFIRNG